MLILGIDPGAHGAIAILQFGVLVDVLDMPIDTVKVNGSERARTSAPRLAAMLRDLACRSSVWGVRPGATAFVERVGAMPREGAAGAFTFGVACGIIEGVLAALDIPYTLITPQEWKKGCRCPADKGAARKRAGELFPASASSFARVKDDGRAEAAMIAYYGSGLAG